MSNEKVVAVLWCFVGVALVCFFAALVSARADDAQWSHVQKPVAPQTRPFVIGK